MGGSHGKFDPFDIDWDDFRDHFMHHHRPKAHQNTPWIDEYIQDILSQILPFNPKSSARRTRIKPDIFETHHSVIVRLRIPEGVNVKRLRLFLSTNQVCISGLHEREEVISLPALCRYSGCKAQLKDDILEIRIAKELNEPYREIDIQYL